MRSTEGKERLADYSSDRIHALAASLAHDGTRQYALFPQVKLSLIPLRKWKGRYMLSSWIRYLVKTGPQIELTVPLLSINFEVVG